MVSTLSSTTKIHIDLSNTLKEWLEAEQYIVETAADGKDALQLISGCNYEFALLEFLIRHPVQEPRLEQLLEPFCIKKN